MKKIAFIFLLPVLIYAKEFRQGSLFDTSIAWDVIKDTTLSVPQDLYNIAVTPFEHPSESLTALGVVGGLILVDHPSTVFYQEYIEKPLDLYSLPTLFIDTPITRGADSWIVFGMIGHYLTGFALGSERDQVTAILAGKAVAYSFLTSHIILKTLTARQRPKDNLAECIDSRSEYHVCDPYDFGNWHPPYLSSNQNGTSLPSFHLTMYFSVARVYAEMYDNYWLPYIGVALIHMSDITGHQHWVSDMVAGAIIGTFIGSQVVSSYKNHTETKSDTFSILPRYNGLALSYTY